MLRTKMLCASLLWLTTATVATAQDSPSPGDPPAGAPSPEAVHANALGQFDADGDGALIGEELGRARDFLQALRGLVGDRGPRERGPRDGEGRRRPLRGDRTDRDRAERGGPDRGAPPEFGDAPPWDGGDVRPPGEGGNADEADGPERGPRPQRIPRGQAMMRLFEEFDGDSSGSLSREEFAELMGAFRERRGPGGPPRDGDPIGPPNGPRGPEFEGASDQGPPSGDGRPPRGGRGRGRGFSGPDGPPEGFQGGDRPRGRGGDRREDPATF
jgi:hypothetical protein